MKIIKKLNFYKLFVIAFFLLFATAYSQNIVSNPEYQRLKSLNNDTIKVNRLLQFVEGMLDTLPSESRTILEDILSLTKEIKDRTIQAIC